MNPCRTFKATVYGRPYPAFACGCNDHTQCNCNSGVRLTITQAELLIEAEAEGASYPLRADLLLSLASLDSRVILIDAMRQLAEYIHSGDIEFRCAAWGVGYARCCLTNMPVSGGKPHDGSDATISGWVGVPRHRDQPPESFEVSQYMCPVCQTTLPLVWEGLYAKFKNLQAKLWKIVAFDNSPVKGSVRR